MTKPRIRTTDCSLVVIDVQGKLAGLMHDKENLFRNITVLIKAARALDIPITYCQQVPEALGPTIDEVAELLKDIEPINKAAFSCCGSEQFNAEINARDRRAVLVCGIETHVCVYQTASDLQRKGYDVYVIGDAVSSRTADNRQYALARMAREEITIASTEMILFELLQTAEHEKFRELARLIR